MKPHELWKTHLILTGSFFLFFIYLAVKYQAVPFSDYKVYWDTCDHWDQYIQGGFLLLYYLPFKWLGLPPCFSALMVNGLLWLAVSHCLWGLERKGTQKIATFSLVPIGFWWSGMSSLVCSELPHVALVILALHSVRRYFRDRQKKDLVHFALFLLMGISIRRQVFFTCLVILAFSGFCYWAGGMDKKVRPYVKPLALLLGLAILLSAAMDSYFTTHSAQKETAKVNARMNFYNGFFTPVMDPHLCGAYSVESTRIDEAEKDLPFSEVIQKHVLSRPLSVDLQIMGWKVARWVRFKYFSFQTLKASLPPGGTPPMILNPYLDEHPSLKHLAYRFLGISPDNPKPIEMDELGFWWAVEAVLGSLFKWTLFALSILYFIAWRRWPGSIRSKTILWTPFLVYLSYLLLHSIMEIQSRYIIGPLLFTYFAFLYFFEAIQGEEVLPRWLSEKPVGPNRLR